MGKGTIGALTAVLVWFSAATAAEAQVGIDTAGPGVIDADDITTTAIGNVTGATSGQFRVRFYLDGSCRHSTLWQGFSGTTITYTPPLGTLGWGLYSPGQFKTEISIKVSGVIYTDHLTITVDPADGNYYGFAPADKSGGTDPGVEALAWLDRKSVEVLA